MKDRLQRFLTSEGLSPAKFADEIGVQRSSISHLLSGRNKPGYDFIYKFSLRYSQVNIDWLITGRGAMYKQKTEDKTGSEGIEMPFNQDNKSTPDLGKHKEFTNVNNIERVVIFYSNGTFKEYTPE
ncbi:MAG: helix-turn-helix domain-containing protein [Bacteroidota bacterium]